MGFIPRIKFDILHPELVQNTLTMYWVHGFAVGAATFDGCANVERMAKEFTDGVIELLYDDKLTGKPRQEALAECWRRYRETGEVTAE